MVAVFFAKALQNRIHLKVGVLDSDSQSIDFCKREGIEATHGDVLKPTIVGDEKLEDLIEAIFDWTEVSDLTEWIRQQQVEFNRAN